MHQNLNRAGGGRHLSTVPQGVAGDFIHQQNNMMAPNPPNGAEAVLAPAATHVPHKSMMPTVGGSQPA